MNNRKSILFLVVLLVLCFVLGGCSEQPENMSMREAAEEYGWEKEDFIDYIRENYGGYELRQEFLESIDKYELLEYVCETYEPDEILDFSPYVDSVMAEIVLDLYYDEIINCLNDR